MLTVFTNFEVLVPFKLNVLVRRRAHITSMAPFTTHMRAMEVRGRPRRQLISSCFAAQNPLLLHLRTVFINLVS